MMVLSVNCTILLTGARSLITPIPWKAIPEYRKQEYKVLRGTLDIQPVYESVMLMPVGVEAARYAQAVVRLTCIHMNMSVTPVAFIVDINDVVFEVDKKVANAVPGLCVRVAHARA